MTRLRGVSRFAPLLALGAIGVCAAADPPPAAGPATPAAVAPAPAPPQAAAALDPAGFAVGGVKLGMTPAEVLAALHGRDFDAQTIRRPTADGHDTFVAALLLRSKAVKAKPPSTRASAEKSADKITDKSTDKARRPAQADPMVVPVEQIAVVFSQFGGNRATEIVRLRRYGTDELVGDAKLRVALQSSYGLTLPAPESGPDASDTLTVTRAWPVRSPDAPATPDKTAASAPPAGTSQKETPPSAAQAAAKLPDCASIADHTGFDMALLASDPGLAAMPLWTGFVPGCAVTLSVSAHRAASDGNAYDLIFQHLIDQSAALADLAALRTAREQAAAAAAKAKQEAAAGHAPSL